MMSRSRSAAAGLLGIAAIAAASAAVAADVEHGKVVFAACAACHSEKPDALGPSLKAVVGRKSAALHPLYGADKIARFFIGVAGKNAHRDIRIEPAMINGSIGAAPHNMKLNALSAAAASAGVIANGTM